MPRIKSFEVLKSGREQLHCRLRDDSLAIVKVETDDATFLSPCFLVEQTNRHIVIGYCVNAQRHQWEVARIDRKRIKHYAVVGPGMRKKDITNGMKVKKEVAA